MIDLKSQRQDLEKKKKKGIVEEELQRFSAKEEDINITRELIEEEKALLRGALSVRDLISPASFKVNPTYLMLGQKFLRTIFVITYPRYISVGWFAPIINLNECFDVSMFFYPVKSAIILKQLKSRVGNLEAQIMSDSEKGAPRDPIRETALRDIESLRDSLTQGTERFFQFGLYITIYADDLEQLDRLSDQVEDVFGSRLVYSKRAFYQAEQGFNSCLPIGNDDLYITFNMNSSPIASSFPFISSELTSDRGVLYGINRHNNSLILFDRFSLQNANSVVFATSGAGKSYCIKLEVLRSLMMGSDVIVIDPEYEY
ncbi:MAG: conjugal transfer protein TraC, partial [Patescibacteria group bacterium]